jgi:hypothetical protein
VTTNESPGGGRAAIVWAVAVLALMVIGLVLWTAYDAEVTTRAEQEALPDVAFVVTLVAFVISGAIIVSRQPGNLVGWLLMIPGLASPVGALIRVWLVAFDPPPETATLPLWLGIWFQNWSWVLLVFPIFHLLLTFPEGRLLTPRWRWVVLIEITMAGFLVGVITFLDSLPVGEGDTVLWSIPNPIGFIPDTFFAGVFPVAWSLGLLGLTVAGVVAFAKRFRKGSASVRQQLKWPMYAVAFFGVVYGATAVGGGDVPAVWDALFSLALAAIPVSVAIAVLRYRLYDLDRLVSRTVTYAAVAVLLIAAYGAVVATLGSFMGRDNPVAVAAATLAAAALFNPVRTRIRRWMDRRFNRPRYDAERVVEDFTATLRDRVDPDRVVEEWVEVVSAAMHPESVAAWIRKS